MRSVNKSFPRGRVTHPWAFLVDFWGAPFMKNSCDALDFSAGDCSGMTVLGWDKSSPHPEVKSPNMRAVTIYRENDRVGFIRLIGLAHQGFRSIQSTHNDEAT